MFRNWVALGVAVFWGLVVKGKTRAIISFAGGVSLACSFLLVGGHSLAANALAESEDTNQAAVQEERAAAARELNRLSEDEARLLEAKSAPAKDPASAAQGGVITEAEPAVLKSRLAETVEAKKALERQQESFLNEILKLRRQVKALEAQAQKIVDDSAEEREKDFKEEIRNEHSKVAKLENELNGELGRQKDERNFKRIEENLSNELSAERKRLVQKDKELGELKRQIEVSTQAVAERSELKRNYIKSKQRVEQLELELQVRATLESDNTFLKGEVKRLTDAVKTSTKGDSQQQGYAAQVKADLEQSKKQLAELKQQKDSAEQQLQNQQEKIAKVIEKIRQITEQNQELSAQIASLKKDVEGKNQLIAGTNGFGNDLKRLHAEVSKLEEELRASNEVRDNVQNELVALKTKNENDQLQSVKVTKDLEETAAQAKAKEEELVTLKRQISKTIEETRVCNLSVDEKQAELRSLPELTNQLSEMRKNLSTKEQEHNGCVAELQRANERAARMPDLEKALVSAKNELMLQQTELQVVGKPADKRIAPAAAGTGPVVSDRAKAIRAQAARARFEQSPMTDKQLSLQAAQAMVEAGKRAVTDERRPAAAVAAEPVVSADVMLLEVKSSKVNLRSGPGEEHSAIMQVQKGARLTVESREGDWFRVFTPTGGRAYINKDVVRALNDGAAESVGPAGPAIVVPEIAAAPAVPRRGPSVPAARAVRDESNVVPFGKVKMGGSNQDIEAVALERLRSSLGNKPEAPPADAQQSGSSGE